MPRPQILSLRERLDADEELAGRGVCVALVDLGFYAHPDLLHPKKRIRAFVDVTRERPRARDLYSPRASSWHGMMTACTAVGSGYVSGGHFSGLASEADVVLIKVGDAGNPRVRGRHVASAIRIPLRHPELGIRLLNVSLGVSADDPDVDDVLAAVAEATAAGITVFAAAGNDESSPVEAPASSPHAITVGGSNDAGTRDSRDDTAFRSSHSGDKPDLVAPASMLPAPMLPGTLVAREAVALYQLITVLEEASAEQEFAVETGEEISDESRASLASICGAVEARMQRAKYVSPDHQHVDGTSFASPIVMSVAAHMLEAAPQLTPAQLRAGLLSTAVPLPDVPRARQGAGVVQPRAAVEWARRQ